MYLLLFLLWVIFNGQLTLEIALFGIVIAGLIYAFMCKFMDYSIYMDLYICKRVFKIIRYFFVLLWEILKANTAVMKLVLSIHKKPQPQLITFQVNLKTNIGRVLLANSITLTPGTITVALEEDNQFVVHCLDKSLAEGIDNSVFVRLIADMEGDYQGYLAEKKARKAGEKA